MGDGPTFTLSLLAMCPLAERLGYVTEEMAGGLTLVSTFQLKPQHLSALKPSTFHH